MVPTAFDEENAVLGKPEGMTADDCECLSVRLTANADGHPVVVSCWKVTQEELDEIRRTGRVWLIVHGQTMPPVSLSGLLPWYAPPPS